VDAEDVARAIEFCLKRSDIEGPVNVCAPEAATNGEVGQAIAKVLHRPNLFPVPSFGLKALFGEGAESIIKGQRVKPRVLLEHGFRFERTDLMECVRAHL
jgi:NAD dependent epimerase/dehydratase family enzyme